MGADTKEKSQPRVVTIYTESNPNPNSMKFVVNFMLVDEGKSYDFPDRNSAKDAPLAFNLFENFSFVDRVFYMNNFVTVTKSDAVDWLEAKPLLGEYIKYHLEQDEPLLEQNRVVKEKPIEPGEHGEIIGKIKDILDEYIKPAVEMDGGAISFDSYQNGIVKVLLQGSCSGCPSSTITLKAGIESLLKRAIPEVQSVEASEV
jgi:NFU1 iron-sulfur cluster scaffold homolog, mitochondrial